MYLFLFESVHIPEGYLQAFNKRMYEALLSTGIGTYIGRI